MLSIAACQIFDQAYLLFWRDQSNSSPEASLFYAIYLFQQAFRQFNFGFAAAMAWLLFGEPITLTTVIGIAITALGVSLVVRPAAASSGRR